ncbi:MAG: hypothetical protein AAF926_03960 [Pseudomonadota bacterium]
MDDLTNDIPWLMTAEAMWDFTARDASSDEAAMHISQDSAEDEDAPLFI